MQHQNVSQYVIVGGGTAGWMTAALLSKVLPQSSVSITLVESPDQPSVGVGEATVPSFVDFVRLLGINEQEFIASTAATFKLGIRFSDWLHKGHSYWHPFGNVGARIDGQSFFQQWLNARQGGLQNDYTDFSPSARMAEKQRFFVPDPAKPTNLSRMGYAYHFDAQRVADFLCDYATSRGVIHKREHIEKVRVDSTLGTVTGLTTAGGNAIDGEFFIDCSGDKALLLGKTLGVAFESWQHYLPVNGAIVAQSEKCSSLPPYTESVAEPMGWRWRIPLQNRVGNGLVFCDQYCSVEQATAYFSDCLKDSVTTEPKHLRFETGRRQVFWEKNCVAIGLSSGFLEPLESTGIYLIMRGILNLAKLLPSLPECQATTAEYNRLMAAEYENIRDFIVLHYCLSARDDSPFWQSWQHRELPDSLQQKLALYNTRGALVHNDLDLFASDSWHAVLAGMGVLPRGMDPLVENTNVSELIKLLQKIDYSLNHSVEQLFDHKYFLARYGPC